MGSAGTSSDRKMNVFIWDMDETLVLLKSLINGTYAEAFSGLKNVKNGAEIGKMWENNILQICDDYFFYEQIENFNQPYLDFMSQYDDGQDLSDYDFDQDGFGPELDYVNKRKLAYRHRAIAFKYKQGLHSILDEDMIKLWENLYHMTDSYTDKWLSSARICLEQCATGNRDLTPNIVSPATPYNTEDHHVNVLVTTGALIPSLVKCLLFRFDGLISCENGGLLSFTALPATSLVPPCCAYSVILPVRLVYLDSIMLVQMNFRMHFQPKNINDTDYKHVKSLMIKNILLRNSLKLFNELLPNILFTHIKQPAQIQHVCYYIIDNVSQ